MPQQLADIEVSVDGAIEIDAERGSDYRSMTRHNRVGSGGGRVQVTTTGRTPSSMPGLDIAELKSWQNYIDAALRLQARLNHELNEGYRLTLEDVRLLHALDRSETGAVRMGELAQALVSTPSRISRRVDRLEARDLAHRATSDRDGRFVLAEITSEGRRLLEKAMTTYAQGVRDCYLAPLSRPQVAAMADNCRRINAGLAPTVG